MKHIMLVGKEYRNSESEQPLACQDICWTYDRGHCSGIDFCNYDFGSNCAPVDYCDADLD